MGGGHGPVKRTGCVQGIYQGEEQDASEPIIGNEVKRFDGLFRYNGQSGVVGAFSDLL